MYIDRKDLLVSSICNFHLAGLQSSSQYSAVLCSTSKWSVLRSSALLSNIEVHLMGQKLNTEIWGGSRKGGGYPGEKKKKKYI